MANTHLSLKEFNTLYPNKTITDYAKYNWLGGGITPPTPPTPSVNYYLDFTKQDTFNELVNASDWVSSEAHTDFTLYRRVDNFTQVLSADGTTLSTVGTTSHDRYGLTITGSKTLGNKYMYEVNFQLNWTGQPVESGNKTLLGFFFGDIPNVGDHTRCSVITNNGTTTISIEAITVEGSTSRTSLTSTEFAPNTVKKLQLKYDLDNHTIEILLDDNSLGSYPFYGGSLGYASISGTGQASYKPNTNLLIKGIEIRGV